jgi:hypothetical protein
LFLKVKHKINFAFAFVLVFVIFLVLPLVNISVGTIYKDECQVNASIPLWLIIDGTFVIMLGLSLFLFKYYDCSLLTSVIGLFLFSWLIRGSIWVYKAKAHVVFDQASSVFYCNTVCYLLAFWNITTSWLIIGFFVLTLVTSACHNECNKAVDDNY